MAASPSKAFAHGQIEAANFDQNDLLFQIHAWPILTK